MDLTDLLKRPEGKTLEFKRDLSSVAGVLRAVEQLKCASSVSKAAPCSRQLAAIHKQWSITDARDAFEATTSEAQVDWPTAKGLKPVNEMAASMASFRAR